MSVISELSVQSTMWGPYLSQLQWLGSYAYTQVFNIWAKVKISTSEPHVTFLSM